jgi:hypothetical protein
MGSIHADRKSSYSMLLQVMAVSDNRLARFGPRLTDLAVEATFPPHVATVLRRVGWNKHLESTSANIRPVLAPCGEGTCSGDPMDGDAFRRVPRSDGRG